MADEGVTLPKNRLWTLDVVVSACPEGGFHMMTSIGGRLYEATGATDHEAFANLRAAVFAAKGG
jgi:hypothetical protein